jgi:starch synthase
MILIGHPTGNPNSHQAALAHYEAGRLEAFCVPWFPGRASLGVLAKLPGMQAGVARLARRRFEPLARAPKIQGRATETLRLLQRMSGVGSEGMAYQANDWLMRTMKHASSRLSVTAVHGYEDCSLWQFEEAKRLGKACVYDMPTCYYPWWEEREKRLLSEYARWIPEQGIEAHRWVRPKQKKQEMELADIVLAPSSFVKRTITERCDKRVEVCLYGGGGASAESGYFPSVEPVEKVRFLHVGQCSIRKGTPFLLELWRRLAPEDAELTIAGKWNLSGARLKELPLGASFVGHLDPARLRDLYAKSHVLLFPSFSDGFGLVMLEALAAGMAVIGSSTSGAPDLAPGASVTVAEAGDVDAWAEAIKQRIQKLRAGGHSRSLHASCARAHTWTTYRAAVNVATADLF